LQAQQAGASEKGTAQLQAQIDALKALVSSLSARRLVSPEGAVIVVDVVRAATDPSNACLWKLSPWLKFVVRTVNQTTAP